MHAFNSRELPKKFIWLPGTLASTKLVQAHNLTSLIPEFYARQIDAVNSGDRSYSMLLDERQQLERRAGRPLLAPFPLADEVRRNIEIICEHRLAHMLALPEKLDLFWR